MSVSYFEMTMTHDGRGASLTLDRAPLNVMTIEMMEQVNAALLELRDNTRLKVLVLRGRGEAFCCGVDVNEHTEEKIPRLLQVFHRMFETIRLLDVVTVAAVHGPAIAGGFELAIGCNLVVAAESATFQLPEVRQGVFPPVAAVVLPRAAPRRKAMEWILLGDRLRAQELYNFGLVNRVWPDARFETELTAFLDTLTSRSGPVMQLARRAQTESYYSTFEEALYKVENLYLRELITLDDPHEGIRAFLEKRQPQWRDG